MIRRSSALMAFGAAAFAAALLVLRPMPGNAQDSFSEAQRDEIGSIVREYLIANPGVLEEVVEALERQQAETQAEAARAALAENSDAIFRSPNDIVAGNPDGDVTLVEFFDYNCGHCRNMLPAVQELIDGDPELRVVFKEWPVLGPESVEAARVAVAVGREAPDRYLDFHVALMSEQGRVDGGRALDVAEEMGLDRDTIEVAVADPGVNEPLAENRRIGDLLGLRGTPTYIVGDEVMMGAVGGETLGATIASVRENGCEVC